MSDVATGGRDARNGQLVRYALVIEEVFADLDTIEQQYGSTYLVLDALFDRAIRALRDGRGTTRIVFVRIAACAIAIASRLK